MNQEEPSREAIQEENRRLRWLRWQCRILTSVLYQERDLRPAEARRLIWNLRDQVSTVFPDKEGTFDLILLPRFDRIMRERWGVGFDSAMLNLEFIASSLNRQRQSCHPAAQLLGLRNHRPYILSPDNGE